MNSQSAPLVNKLILVVLGGILGCLVLLVIRAYRPVPAAPGPDVVETAEAAPVGTAELVPEPGPPPVAQPTPRPQAKPATRPVPVRSAPVAVAPSDVVETVALADSVASPTDPNLLVPAPVAVAEIVTPVPVVPARGSIVGTVTLSGIPKPEVPIDLGPSCGRLRPERPTTRHFVVGPEGQLANVLVHISSSLNWTQPPRRASAEPLLDQVGCMFEPYVMALLAGQRFKIRNSDPELHNIHATPRVNREFNIGQSRRGQVNERVFDRPELFVRLKCDVHPWMFAYVNAMEHPFFAITSTNGFFALPPGLPPGRYTVSAAHLKAGTQSQEIDLLDDEPKAVNFVLKVDTEGRAQRNVAATRPPTVP